MSITASAFSKDGKLLSSFTAQSPTTLGTFGSVQKFRFTAVSNNSMIKFVDTSTATQGVDILIDNVNINGLYSIISIHKHPQPQQVPRGGKAVFSVGVSHASPDKLAYQWLFNGAANASATSNTLILENVTSFFNGMYSVQITDLSLGITVDSTSAEQEVSDFVLTPFAALEIRIPSEQGKSYQIEASSDLVTWLNYGDPITGTGQYIYKFFSTRNSNMKYFRLKAN